MTAVEFLLTLCLVPSAIVVAVWLLAVAGRSSWRSLRRWRRFHDLNIWKPT